ncbi:MAG: EthD family reductase [Chloroflexi bacterium]|nr:EthD family reductase [Chloroflexota bacterium]
MHKLVIVIEQMNDSSAFDEAWPGFLHLAESMPGLLRETFSRVDAILFGKTLPGLIFELYFDSPESARAAMASPAGREAGRLLQQITGGRVSLFLADHKENTPGNIGENTPQNS